MVTILDSTAAPLLHSHGFLEKPWSSNPPSAPAFLDSANLGQGRCRRSGIGMPSGQRSIRRKGISLKAEGDSDIHDTDC